MAKKRNKKVSVALKMEDYGKTVPKVAASGLGKLAERILEIANENEIPIYEDKELAESLSYLEVGMALPEDLFPAVAEIIAHIHFIAKGYKDVPVNPKAKRINLS